MLCFITVKFRVSVRTLLFIYLTRWFDQISVVVFILKQACVFVLAISDFHSFHLQSTYYTKLLLITRCAAPCKACTGPKKNQCTKCMSNRTLRDGVCFPSPVCQDGKSGYGSFFIYLQLFALHVITNQSVIYSRLHAICYLGTLKINK